MRVLLYGKDARTVALANACEASPRAVTLFACSEFRVPGLLGDHAKIHVASLRDLGAMVRYALEVRPHLAIVGPEDPLEAGLVDELEAKGIPCFGPRRAAARIETSKAWARDLLARHGIPGLPEYRVFESANGLEEYLIRLGEFVVKPDGLTGGKGVRVFGEHLATIQDAVGYATEVLGKGQPVVVERRLQGEEFSLQSITDGQTVVHCPVVQDHKRAFEGDKGPNTGGMGSYSCSDFSLPFLESRDVESARRINEAVVHAIASETTTTYRGVLYGGFIATREGVFVIEYNARFGDPEALNVVPIMGDFLEVADAAASGNLHQVRPRFEPKATVCKYVVPKGYPDAPVRGVPITVDLDAVRDCGGKAYFAAVDEVSGEKRLTGSRAVALVGIGDSLAEAERAAERATAAVSGPVWHRQDIGTEALVRARVEHMREVRNEERAGRRPSPGA